MRLNNTQKTAIEMKVLQLRAEVEACACPLEKRRMNRRLQGLSELLGIKLLSAQSTKKSPQAKRKRKQKRRGKKSGTSQRAGLQDSMVKLAAHSGPVRFVQGGGVNGK